MPDANMFWDFHVGNPEGIHEIMHLFSDRGTPASLRHMNAYSGHTYKFTLEVRLSNILSSCNVRRAQVRVQEESQ
ncbi:catalase-domain-containing protein [Lipomyces doorenjongii]